LPIVLLHGPNCLWGPVFHEILDVKMDAPCFKFVKPITSFDATKAIVLPDNLKMATLEKADVNLVHSTNKIAYDISYVEDCFRISSAIRTFDNNELAAWSMTHRDCKSILSKLIDTEQLLIHSPVFVGSLHVLPEYRRRGCAEIILQDLCRQYAEYYRRTLPDTLAEKAYFGSAVEKFNDSSANLFTKTGWKSVGLGITWIYAGKKEA
jgi:ribosomal protein S18 acetylase RimI-like enzyme